MYRCFCFSDGLTDVTMHQSYDHQFAGAWWFNTILRTSNFQVMFIILFQKANLIPGGNDSLVFTTISGTVGILVPFTSREDHDFFQHLEMHMRAENPPLAGRDHLSYRSYYYPVKNVIDGDLCEQ